MTHLHLRFLTNRYFLTTGQGQGGVGLCLSTTQGAVPDLGAGQHVSQSTPRSESRLRAPAFTAPLRPASPSPGPHRGPQSRPAKLSPLPAGVVRAAGRANTFTPFTPFTPLPGRNSPLSGSREGRTARCAHREARPSSLPPAEAATLLPRPLAAGRLPPPTPARPKEQDEDRLPAKCASRWKAQS